MEKVAAGRQGITVWMVMAMLVWLLASVGVVQARQFGDYVVEVEPALVYPGVDPIGPLTGTPPQAEVKQNGKKVGYVFLTSDIGYSGKPIQILVGMTLEGKVVGAKVIRHSEPILLVGIPEEKLFEFVERFIGRTPTAKETTASVDAVSGATVTAIVINDGIKRAARQVLRGSGGQQEQAVKVTFNPPPFAATDWTTLLGEGAIRRLFLQNGDVDQAFKKMGVGSGEPYAKSGPADGLFIDLYATLATPEVIGRNLIGVAEYQNLLQRVGDSQKTLLIMANGEYSFRGSGFVRGGIFDRIKLIQEDTIYLFRDKDYKRLGNLEPGMPDFVEIGLFSIPAEVAFDPARPWTLELLVQRPVGPIEKAYTAFNLDYSPAPRFIKSEEPVVPSVEVEDSTPLWMTVWQGRVMDIVILSIS
ncbi:MAG: FMN-binding protein, partial [Magnetococcales bacterium]|nr:FMN-binding protein [Magnetococcales bacterium]